MRQSSKEQYYQTQISGNSENALKRVLGKIINNKTLLIIIAVLQLIMIVLILNPASLIQQYQNKQVVDEVAAKTTVNKDENPVIATITDAEALRSENAAQAQVYKDARNGDYVLGYADKMIIYRRSEGTIIYEGDNPSTLINNVQKKLLDDISLKAKELALISEDSTETPQVSIITDIQSLQANNPDFYSVARNNDIIGLFPQAQVIVLYNQETETIVNSGKYSTNISTLE